MLHSIFDIDVVDVHASFYQGQVAPDLYPDEPQMRVENWHPEDQVAYAGGEYAKAAYAQIN